MTFKILVVDQFAGPSPYWLQQNHPVKFDQLVEELLAQPVPIYVQQRPELLEVDENYLPPYATTTFRADANGNAEVWRYRWDTSG